MNTENRILGLHHITAIADDAQRNYNFYTKVLGLRLVKRTVNFDDPGTYHFYYGNENGTPGTILTFFPWEGIGKGSAGVGQATEIAYSVPENSLAFWKERFKEFNVTTNGIEERFGELYLPFQDPDGLNLTLVTPKLIDNRDSWTIDGITKNVATKGFYNTTLTLDKLEPTAKVLTDVLGYKFSTEEGNRFRFTTDAHETASVIDIVVNAKGERGVTRGGTNHHIAFRVKNDEVQMEYREKVMSLGLQITPKIDRDYFYSLYFREPGGVLFEIATDNPGFTVDEPLNELGHNLKLPRQYENIRKDIEKVLPPLSL